ncbi:antibiotic resistance protein MarC [Ignicoccus pacificus DSM 13166]|uniref:UPF0056 membrane protein n=1 Tax=Ignicoccus pacificus DSM 13166 TaxID=940294 RepID=A0A977KBR4_9CREN|nr:antibiotic resistance protein MarC [Ignicoccus pacificus DSM 13166]
MDIASLINAFLALFIIIDPLTNGPIFYSMTSSLSDEKRKKIIRKSVIVATAVLLLFALFGDLIVEPFGMTVNDIRIATGLILLIYAIQALLGQSEASMIDPESVAIVPMAIPMLAGPGAISLVLYYRSSCGPICTAIAVIGVMLVTLPLLMLGRALYKVLGKNGILALSRIIAILLAGLGVAMIREGIMMILRVT